MKAYSHTTRNLAILFLMLLSIWACRREFERPDVQNEILTPILTTALTINDIVPDSIRSVDANNFVSLVYRNPIYSASLATFDPLQTREFSQTASLQTLTLPPQSVTRPITLGEVARVVGGSVGNDIINSHGMLDDIPPFPFQYDSIHIDASHLFESITLVEGYLEVKIENRLPTAISNAILQLRNQSSSDVLGSTTFPFIPKQGVVMDTIDMAGKTIEGLLHGHIVNLIGDGTNGNQVLIDTNDAVDVTITLRDMKVLQATAEFPSQNVIHIADTVGFQNIGDLRLTKATAKTGTVNIRVISTIPEALEFEYKIPGGLKDGDTFRISETVPAAPSGGSSDAEFTYALDGYTFDLTGHPDSSIYNSVYSALKGSIVTSGNVVTIGLDDSISVIVQLEGIIPEYIEGYLGNTASSVGPVEVPLTLFRSITDGTIEFEDITMSVGISNHVGVPFNVQLDELSVRNTNSGKSYNFDVSGFPNPIEIQPAIDVQTPWEGSWDLQSGSALNEALNVFPNRVRSSLSFETNPAENSNDLTQFAVDSSDLEAFMDLEIPLSLIADRLTLTDTAAFSSSAIQDPEQVLDGELYLNVSNSFPLSAAFYLEFLDASGIVLQRVQFDGLVDAGSQNQAVEDVLTWPFSRIELEQILRSTQVVFHATVNTSSTASFQKIYSDQGLVITVSTRLNYLFVNE